MNQKNMYQPHYAKSADSRIVQTREKLRQIFLELLAAKPLEQITIREITASAGVGYNTFFRHYTSKEELLEEIIADEIKRLIDLSISVIDITNSLEAAKALCNYVAEHDALWSKLLSGGAANAMREAFIEYVLQVSPARTRSTETYPSEIGAKLVGVGTIELLTWWLEQTKRPSVEEFATICNQLVLAPVAKAYGK